MTGPFDDMSQASKATAVPVAGLPIECLLSGVGGFLAIYVMNILTGHLLGGGHILFVVSMGAAAMLLFAVPHSPMSQPWALVTGNLASAAIGVTIAQWVPDATIAAGLAVGCSIVAMHLLRCLHPPASATALTAVIGGPSITSLGYEYLVAPVLLNVLLLMVMAVIFNWPFAWRRYPAVFAKSSHDATQGAPSTLSPESIAEALRRSETYIDVDERDLEQIFRLACELERERGRSPDSKLAPSDE